MINCLLNNGADVNKLNDDGVSALVISFFNLYPVSIFTESSHSITVSSETSHSLSAQQEHLIKYAICCFLYLSGHLCVSARVYLCSYLSIPLCICLYVLLSICGALMLL